MTEFSRRLKEIQSRHGPASVAFLSTGQIMTEEMFFLGALAKFGMGLVHGDGNTRQCMATSVVAHKESFGFDAPPYSLDDLEASDVLVFVGANPAIAHPIMWQRVERNPHQPEIIVIDPRATETALAATQHLAIAPKSDLILFYCLANWLIRHSHVRRPFIDQHTSGYDEFARFVHWFSPETYLGRLGVTSEQFERFAQTVARGNRVSFWWTMGVNQGHEGVRTAQAIINVALMTGNIGRPGTGANSITGQCNAMGSRLFSNTTGLFGGHEFTEASHRSRIAAALQIPVERIPDQTGWAYDQILAGVESGDIRALWIICTNPAHSWIEQERFQRLRQKLEFLVVQDMFTTTETARLADLLLPAAGWGEKEGTFINSERRIGRCRKVCNSPGQALADFQIFRLIAHYWGCGKMFSRWETPEVVFHLMRECSRGQPCDFTGITGYDMIEACGGIQWPFPEGDPGAAPPPARRLFEDGKFFTSDGRARFVFDEPRPVPEPPDSEYPFVLLTGRGSSAQWHTQSRTAKSAILRKLYPPGLYVEIHPADARQWRISDNSPVRVATRRASLVARARLTATIQRGQIFLPMHDPVVNKLTLWCVDPHSRQPAYKHCAAQIEPVGNRRSR
jgi:assimilatory nitrate reductase catalytic subunit